jgi:23S rRNA pseudouridine1911/1915/1917 synthase
MRGGGVEILHEDNHLLVLNKPACVPSVPDASEDESLYDRARADIKQRHAKPGEVFLGVVQRLDRPVSGVIVFARTSKAAARLSESLREKTARKTYWALVEGAPPSDSGLLEQWLLKDEATNRVQVVREGTADAKLAQTRWRSLRRLGRYTWLELEPLTGRAHQLRVACASLGTPIQGDLKYGAGAALPDASIALHARRLELAHPTLRRTLVFEAPLPRGAHWDPCRK